jgi:hypothetical protein
VDDCSFRDSPPLLSIDVEDLFVVTVPVTGDTVVDFVVLVVEDCAKAAPPNSTAPNAPITKAFLMLCAPPIVARAHPRDAARTAGIGSTDLPKTVLLEAGSGASPRRVACGGLYDCKKLWIT